MMSLKQFTLLLLLLVSIYEEIQAFSSIACENSDLAIQCDEGTMIKVTYANYGRMSPIHCDDGKNVRDLNCKSETSLATVQNRCNSQRTCIIGAHNSVFGDPCVHTIKYLEVKYECIPAPDVPASKYKSSIACEHNELNIGCKEGELIKVVNANYGRMSKSTCDDGHNVHNLNCKAATSNSIVQNRCDSKRNCTVGAHNSVFGDPCVNTIKYLEVQYECMASEPVAANTTETDPSFSRLNLCPSVDYSTFKTVIACEHNQLPFDNLVKIECQEGELIHIIRANYGRLTNGICNKAEVKTWDTNCMSQKSFWIVDSRCNSLRTCTIEATNNLFGDPCLPGTEKYLEVHYKCVPTKAQNNCMCLDIDVRLGGEGEVNVF